MQLAGHELYDLHELTMSCVNSITNMGNFMIHAQDPGLKSMIERHFPFHVRDYNMKVEYLKNAQGPTKELPIPDLNPVLQSFTQSPVAGQTVTPRTNAQTFNDQEIATAYLLTLKRAGREYAWAAMEMSHPDLRLFLEDGFRMSSHHAYDVWQWMVQQGYYPLEPASQISQNTIGDIYQEVPEQNPAATAPVI
ncbi:spore coat protein [Marinithermofilum abyssi]|jgi:spore coat protein CotF|uniref:Spore coat protein n=1 Tax=Marinithermofilum abyssi TaxID=1571185 RepID=A0A8J2VH84_9BACL|nr:spore coat protein [Marinithermofilum abyssi]GGE14331.1 spore coat protein [Marinithermofilum abyssi]